MTAGFTTSIWKQSDIAQNSITQHWSRKWSQNSALSPLGHGSCLFGC